MPLIVIDDIVVDEIVVVAALGVAGSIPMVAWFFLGGSKPRLVSILHQVLYCRSQISWLHNLILTVHLRTEALHNF